jgi:hypothetical protein
VIVAGDFNDWQKKASGYLAAELGLYEVVREVEGKLAKSYPAQMPMLSLDRIYVRDLDIESVRAPCRRGLVPVVGSRCARGATYSQLVLKQRGRWAGTSARRLLSTRPFFFPAQGRELATEITLEILSFLRSFDQRGNVLSRATASSTSVVSARQLINKQRPLRWPHTPLRAAAIAT